MKLNWVMVVFRNLNLAGVAEILITLRIKVSDCFRMVYLRFGGLRNKDMTRLGLLKNKYTNGCFGWIKPGKGEYLAAAAPAFPRPG